MKQTAVEFLQEALEHTILTHEQIMQTIGLFEQVKQMEKQQIVDAYGQGTADEAGEILDATKDAQQYYNETYGTSEKA
jgi:hypothetical protein